MSVTINVYLVSQALLALSFILLCHTCWAARKMLDPFGAAILAAGFVKWAVVCLLIVWYPQAVWVWVLPSMLLWMCARYWLDLRKTLKEITRGSGGDYE